MIRKRAGISTVFVVGTVLMASVAVGDGADHIEMADLGRVDARTGALLIAGGGRGQVDGSATWRLGPQAVDGRGSVRLVVEVDGEGMLQASPPGPIPIVVAAYVFDEAGNLTTFLSQGAMVPETMRDVIRRVGLRWIDDLELAAGAYTVQLVAQNHRTRAVFLTRLELVIPNGEHAPRKVLPPLIDGVAAGWIDARVERNGDPEARVPQARPVVVSGRPCELLIATTGSQSTEVLRTRFVDPAGRTMAQPSLEGAGGDPGDSLYRRYRIDATDLPAGRYRLVIRSPASDDQPESVGFLEVVVAAGEQSLAWPAVSSDGSGKRVAEEDPDIGNKELKRAYRAVLVDLASGRDLEARRKLAELERDVAGSESARALFRLGRVQNKFASEIVNHSSDGLRPVLWFHRTMNRFYRIRQENILATNSWQRVIELAAMLAAKGGPDDRAFAADVLVEQATELVQVPAMRAATRILNRAIMIDLHHVDGLMALGTSLERQGEAMDASKTFKKVVELAPDRAEGRLRYAVNVDRIGDRNGAREQYEQLIEGDGPDWVRVVAVQQLATQLMKSDRNGEAAALLSAANEEFGSIPRLEIQLAYAYSAMGERHRMTETLERLKADADAAPSPRLRYAEWPQLDRKLDHQALAERARSGVPSLRAVVDAKAKDGS